MPGLKFQSNSSTPSVLRCRNLLCTVNVVQKDFFKILEFLHDCINMFLRNKTVFLCIKGAFFGVTNKCQNTFTHLIVCTLRHILFV
jgi:hypothetical protein